MKPCTKHLNDLDAKVTNFIHIVTEGQAEVREEPSTSRLHADSVTSVQDDPLKEEKETTFTLSPVQTMLVAQASTSAPVGSSTPHAPSFAGFVKPSWDGWSSGGGSGPPDDDGGSPRGPGELPSGSRIGGMGIAPMRGVKVEPPEKFNGTQQTQSV